MNDNNEPKPTKTMKTVDHIIKETKEMALDLGPKESVYFDGVDLFKKHTGWCPPHTCCLISGADPDGNIHDPIHHNWDQIRKWLIVDIEYEGWEIETPTNALEDLTPFLGELEKALASGFQY